MQTNRQLLADFATGKVSVAAHTAERLQRIDQYNHHINAVVTHNPQALAQPTHRACPTTSATPCRAARAGKKT